MQEQYTLEEWMGKLDEAGYDINELSPELKARYMDAAKAQVDQNITRTGANPPGSPSSARSVTPGGLSQASANAQRAKVDAKRIKGMSTALDSMNKQLRQRYENPQGKTDAEKAAYQKSASDTFDRAEDNLSRAKEYAKWQSPTAAESYTLEEWMGQLQEAGYDISELSPETLASYNAKATKDLETHNNIMKRDLSNFERKVRNRHKGITKARGVLKAQGMPVEPKVEESTISENTVSRLQELAGVKPLNS